jgi:hypothetical protein
MIRKRAAARSDHFFGEYHGSPERGGKPAFVPSEPAAPKPRRFDMTEHLSS